MRSLPSTVLFDFDGIIVDTEWAIYETWHALFLEQGHPLPLETYNQCIGSNFDTWSPETHLENLTGNSFDWHTLNTDRNIEIRKTLEGSTAIPGVLTALDWLREKSIPLAVVSSSSHDWVDGWIKKIGLTSYFTTTVCRGDAPKIKPAPDLYLEAARQLDLPPADCLVIEDSVNGIKSALAAGMQTIAVPNRVTACRDFSIAHRVLTSLEELPATLKR
ncbi:MAG: HAD family phosphatase [Akkermansiaceae bacterium]|jgi:putative hydrolase of the HAD superfamily|nr:HAD family phosphatase [Akkermansiaceae bacterium]|tara:strand:+ start:331 stop:984 length:654 start_codon:yes stop_codon:yes gene_type:complete